MFASQDGWLFFCPEGVTDFNVRIFDRHGDADDFLDCFIMPARIVGGTFWG